MCTRCAGGAQLALLLLRGSLEAAGGGVARGIRDYVTLLTVNLARKVDRRRPATALEDAHSKHLRTPYAGLLLTACAPASVWPTCQRSLFALWMRKGRTGAAAAISRGGTCARGNEDDRGPWCGRRPRHGLRTRPPGRHGRGSVRFSAVPTPQAATTRATTSLPRTSGHGSPRNPRTAPRPAPAETSKTHRWPADAAVPSPGYHANAHAWAPAHPHPPSNLAYSRRATTSAVVRCRLRPARSRLYPRYRGPRRRRRCGVSLGRHGRSAAGGRRRGRRCPRPVRAPAAARGAAAARRARAPGRVQRVCHHGRSRRRRAAPDARPSGCVPGSGGRCRRGLIVLTDAAGSFSACGAARRGRQDGRRGRRVRSGPARPGRVRLEGPRRPPGGTARVRLAFGQSARPHLTVRASAARARCGGSCGRWTSGNCASGRRCLRTWRPPTATSTCSSTSPATRARAPRWTWTRWRCTGTWTST